MREIKGNCFIVIHIRKMRAVSEKEGSPFYLFLFACFFSYGNDAAVHT